MTEPSRDADAIGDASRPATATRGRTIDAKRGKVVRDSFTMPLADYALIGLLKQRCIRLGIAMKKSELLRAGLATLQRLPDEGLVQVVAAVESVKTGRPPGRRKKKKKKKKARRRKQR